MADAGETDAISDAELRRAVIASTIGTTIEWYDFFLYSTAAGLVFGKLFFPQTNALTATLLSFGTYFVGFLSRPIGAAIFGHYGDRIGRKATLIATLLCMGLATFAIALVPGYAMIGIWGAVLLTVLRVIQGIGVGGEWGGSVLIAMEWSRNKSRGLVASWPQFGVPFGLFLANLAVLVFSALSGGAFLSWGWRVPSLLSLLLVGVGLWVRLGILETPTFRKLVAERRIERAPVLEVIKRQPREILLAALARMSEQAPFYIFTAFVFSYGSGTLGLTQNFVLAAVLVAALISFITIPLSGHISDRIGRRKMYMIGALTVGVFGFVYFGMLDSASPWVVFLAIALSLIPHGMQYGPQAALIAEAFTPRLRYSGASLGYQFAAIIAGGAAAVLPTSLVCGYSTRFSVPAF